MKVAKKIVVLGLLITFLLSQVMGFIMPQAAFGTEKKTLRAGFFALEGYHNIDKNGIKSGYGYELLRAIEHVSNVKFAYVGYDQSWEETLDMLENGEIDVMTWVGKTPELEERFDFSTYATDQASYMLTINENNKEIIARNYETYNGITIGVLEQYKDNVALSVLAQEKGFDYTIRCYETISALEEALEANEVDAIMSHDFRKYENEHMLEKFGQYSCYAIVRKGDAETLAIINDALEKMELINPLWRENLQKQHFVYSDGSLYLTEEERAYLEQVKADGTVFKVLVNPDRYPYSYVEEGQMKGIMVDLFTEIANRVGIQYEYIITNNREEYVKQLSDENTDICIDLTEDFLATQGYSFYTTDAYIEAPFSWVRCANNLGDIQVAGRLIYTYNTPDRYAWNDSYHDIEYITYNTREECIAALRAGEIDGYCTYSYLAESILYDNYRNDLVATIAVTKNAFIIGTAQKHGQYLSEILNESANSIEEYTETNIIRKNTTMEPLPFSIVRLIYQRPLTVLCSVLVVGMMSLFIILQLRYRKKLEKKVAEQEQRLTKSHQSVLDILSTAIEFRSSESGDHVHRIYGITKDILEELSREHTEYMLTETQIELISSASVLHDIGKIAIPDHILNKPGKLNSLEYEVIKQHPQKGCEILEKVPDLGEESIYDYACDICRWHHERWDGAGYPEGLKGDAIPLWAQVVGIADVFDALTSPRVYKSAYDKETALRMIENNESGVFNPKLVAALKKVAQKYPQQEETQINFAASPAGRDVTNLLLEAFQKLLNNTEDIIFLKDIDLVYRAGSPAFARILNKTTMDEVICRKDLELIEDKEIWQRYNSDDISLLENGEDMIDYLEPLVSADGSPRWARTSKYLLTDSSNRIMGILGISRDVTKEYFMQKHYQQELDYLFALPDDVYLSVYIDITRWRLIDERHKEINGAGFGAHKNIGEFKEKFVSGIMDRRWPAYNFYQEFSKENLTALYEQGKYEIIMEYRRELNNGHVCWVRDEIKFIVDPNSGHLCMFLLVRDIEAKKIAEQELVDQAEKDALTGLLNRASIRRLFAESLEEHKAMNTGFAFFLIDIDNFKYINDNFGHQEGDKVLIRFGNAIQACFRTSDLIGRLGGDEFVVMMKNGPLHTAIEEKAEMLRKELEKVCDASGTAYVSASIGISEYPSDGKTIDELYRNADTAMYRAKNKGKNCVVFASEIYKDEENC